MKDILVQIAGFSSVQTTIVVDMDIVNQFCIVIVIQDMREKHAK